MEKEELKLKYNDLLDSLTKGANFLAANPDKAEEAQKRINEITEEMDKISKQIPEATAEELENGFEIKTDTGVITTKENIDNKPVVVLKQNVLESFEDDWKMANQLAKSDILPDNYKNKPANIVIAVGLARQMDLPPFTVMQNLSIIRGKTSWSGSFCKTLIERTGKFKNLELNYIGEKGKDTYGCYLSAIRVSDNKLIKGPEVTMKMAKEEKWTTNPKWLTLTDLMLAYRCQSFFCRLYVPEAMNGIYTDDEVTEISQTREKPIDIL